MFMKTKLIIIILATLATVQFCGNRLRPKLYLVESEERRPLNHIETYYMDNYELVFDGRHDPMATGEGQVLVSRHRGVLSGAEDIQAGILTTTSEMEYRLYVELPPDLEPGRYDIEGKSVCRQMGLYELPDSLWMYYCRYGQLVIDTVKGTRFTAELAAAYFNLAEDSVVFNGRLEGGRRKP